MFKYVENRTVKYSNITCVTTQSSNCNCTQAVYFCCEGHADFYERESRRQQWADRPNFSELAVGLALRCFPSLRGGRSTYGRTIRQST